MHSLGLSRALSVQKSDAGWHRAREDPREPATGSAIHSGISSQECVGVAPRFGDFASFQGSGKLFNGTPQNAG